MKTIVISTIIFIIGNIVLLNYINNSIENNKNTHNLNIGKKFILDKDTLLIIDYSMFKQTYTLSNSKEINESLVK